MSDIAQRLPLLMLLKDVLINEWYPIKRLA